MRPAMRTILCSLFAASLLTACCLGPDEACSPDSDCCETEATAAPAPLAACELGSIEQLTVYDDIYLAGQPSQADFALAKEAGIKTIITLRKDGELEWEQVQVVEQLGMTYVGLPWNGPDELTDRVFDVARELFDTAERPMMMHCGSSNRVGALWLAWRALDGGLSVEEATAEAKTAGLRTDAYLQKALDYVAREQASG